MLRENKPPKTIAQETNNRVVYDGPEDLLEVELVILTGFGREVVWIRSLPHSWNRKKCWSVSDQPIAFGMNPP